MSNAENNIQKYINAYKTTLEDMGAKGITVRDAKKSELEAVSSAIRYPGKTGTFWICSSLSDNKYFVWEVSSNGSFFGNRYNGKGGVRPVIVIS